MVLVFGYNSELLITIDKNLYFKNISETFIVHCSVFKNGWTHTYDSLDRLQYKGEPKSNCKNDFIKSKQTKLKTFLLAVLLPGNNLVL